MTEPHIRWARSATRHRVSRARSRFVIQHCGLWFQVPASAPGLDERLLFLGDDESGVALEVVAVELTTDEILVIHAMELRARYRPHYDEARPWRI